MPAFEYSALEQGGRRISGVITANSAVAARRELRQRGLAPLEVGEAANRAVGAAADRLRSRSAGGLASAAWQRLRRREMTAREQMLFTRQLAALIGASMPVEEVLSLIGEQNQKPYLRRIVLGVRSQVAEGKRLADAMAEFPGSFSGVYRALVAAGEHSGSLATVLARLAEHLEAGQKLRNKITGAMVYPAILTAVAVGVVTLLMTLVVPRIAEQFTGMGMTLPWLTQTMMALSNMLVTGWPILAATCVGVGILTGLALSRPSLRRRWDGLVVRLPGLGGFLRRTEAARFVRTLSILLAEGAVLWDALRAAARASSNLAFKEAIFEVVRDVEAGRALAPALSRGPWIPDLVLYLVAAGERTGQLAEMTGRAADQLEQDIEANIAVGLSLLEPAIILALGVVVVLIVFSILLPILQLNTLALG